MEYKISIVTPYHNVEPQLFEECVKSMRSQTIGFENVQWIIVVHNSEPHHLPALQQMFRNDSNVVVEALNNDYRTPSSPRNHALALATAPIVGLLDSDDSYTDDCLATVVAEMEETHSDMLNVRREVVIDSDNLRVFTVKMLFNNTERRTIMERRHWDTEKMFGYPWGISTAYFYSASLLKDYDINFDVNLLFAEDFLFVAHCIAHARRICYLNQFIGYKYVINANSLVQNPVKPAQTVLAYAKGYKLIFDTLTRYGINNALMVVSHLALLARFILHSKDMTRAIRQEIKDLLGEYLLSAQTAKSNKYYTKEAIADSLHTACDIILNPEKDMQALLRNELDGLYDLRKILLANLNTDFARRNDFESITTLEAWQFRMPLTGADFYKPLVDLQTRVGETRIFTGAKTKLYFKTVSGSLLPCTEEHLRPYRKAIDSILRDHNNVLLAQSKPITRIAIDGAPVDTLKSAVVKAYFKNDYMKHGVAHARFAAPVEYYYASGDDAYRNLVVQSLADGDADQIVAYTCDDVLRLFDFIEHNWQELLPDVPCTAARREVLKAAFSDGFDQPVATKIWPKLTKIIAFGSGEHYQACRDMKRFTGDVTHSHGFYFTEEAILGKATADGSELFECIRGNSFYELMPVADDSTTVCWSQVEKGAPYQLVVTNKAGLYRYVTDHFICPQEISQDSIKFTIY